MIVVPKIQSTARLVTSKNGTWAINSPILTNKEISPEALIARFDVSRALGSEPILSVVSTTWRRTTNICRSDVLLIQAQA